MDDLNTPSQEIKIERCGLLVKRRERQKILNSKEPRRENRTFVGKSGRILKGRGFTDLRYVGNFGGIGFHSETPSPERRKREFAIKNIF